MLQDESKAQTDEEKLDFLCGKGETKKFFVPQIIVSTSNG